MEGHCEEEGNPTARSVTDIVKNYNQMEESTKRTAKQSKNGFVARFFQTRWSGIPFAIIYGLFLYAVIACMILSEEPDVELHEEVKTDIKHRMKDAWKNASKCGPPVTNRSRREMDDVPPVFSCTDRTEPLIISASFTVLLGVSSVFSPGIRCGCVLALPQLLTARSRSILMTFISSLLLEGPVRGITYNMREVSESLSCMYETVKSEACNNMVRLDSVFKNFNEIIKLMNEIIKEKTAQISRDVKEAYKDVLEKTKEVTDKFDADMVDLRSGIGGVGGVMCDVADGAVSFGKTVANGFKAVGNAIAGWFGKKKRKRRSTSITKCGVTIPIPGRPDFNMKSATDFVNQFKPDWKMPNGFDLPDLGNLLDVPDLGMMRKEILNVLKSFFKTVWKYASHINTVILVVSLLRLCSSAASYVRSYYSDDTFDNMYINDNIRKYWKINGLEELLPLRHWELNEKFQVSLSMKLSRREKIALLLKSIIPLLFLVIAIALMVADYLLARMLTLITEKSKFVISFDGMESGLDVQDLLLHASDNRATLMSINLRAFDLSSEPCLPRPLITEAKSNAIIGILLVICVITTIFQAYISRSCVTICDIFYERRAKERAEYLHGRLKAGRGMRKFQLPRLLGLAWKQRELSVEISPWKKVVSLFKRWFKQCTPAGKIRCPGCGWKCKKGNMVEVNVTYSRKKTEVKICNDCKEDF